MDKRINIGSGSKIQRKIERNGRKKIKKNKRKQRIKKS